MPEEPRRSTLTMADEQPPGSRPTPPGSIPPQFLDPYAGGPLGAMPAAPPGGFLTALGGDIADIGRALFGATAGTLEKFHTGQLEPGSPEAIEAARTTAFTVGLPGDAPVGALSSGVRGVGELSKLRRPRTGPLSEEPPAAPRLSRGSEAPLFDYSNLAERPSDVPQTNITRLDPTAGRRKGVPAKYVQAMTDPANRARFLELVQLGREQGLGWYGLQPLRQAFHEELGAEAGEHMFQRYLDYVGATSPQALVMQNVRNASHWFGRERRGEPVPETAKDPGRAPMLVTDLPAPYAGLTGQRLHSLNVRRLRGMDPVGPSEQVRPTMGILDPNWPLTNPKPPSFTANLGGNWQPITADVHNLRGWGMEGAPEPTGYGYIEQVQQDIAREIGMDPAQVQAAGWVGQKGATKGAGKPFLQFFEERVKATAKFHGESPQQTLRKFIRGERDLLQAGDISGMIGSGAVQAGQDQQQ